MFQIVENLYPQDTINPTSFKTQVIRLCVIEVEKIRSDAAESGCKPVSGYKDSDMFRMIAT